MPPEHPAASCREGEADGQEGNSGEAGGGRVAEEVGLAPGRRPVGHPPATVVVLGPLLLGSRLWLRIRVRGVSLPTLGFALLAAALCATALGIAARGLAALVVGALLVAAFLITALVATLLLALAAAALSGTRLAAPFFATRGSAGPTTQAASQWALLGDRTTHVVPGAPAVRLVAAASVGRENVLASVVWLLPIRAEIARLTA
mmetsp:Transcript_72896/g.235873  ORF Transcript_72896/g.235873 Transcript_72896/m.235873 type:complete len:204 (-) Transcript_72896:725-1336(-)